MYPELTGLLRKTAGLVDVLRDALAPLAGQIEQAFVYGSMARGDEHAYSDVDLMVIGKVEFTDVVLALSAAQTTLRRGIDPPCCRVLNSSASCRTPMASSPKCGAAPSCGWWVQVAEAWRTCK